MKIFHSLVLAAALPLSSAAFASDFVPSELPERLACASRSIGSLPEGKAIYYLSGFTDEGHALYQSFGAQTISLLFLPDGTQDPADSRICGGKSLPDLIAEGAGF